MPHTRLAFNNDHSSTISAVAHEGTDLQVSFRSGKVAHYQNVSPEMFASLKTYTDNGGSPRSWLVENGVIAHRSSTEKHPFRYLEAHEVWK